MLTAQKHGKLSRHVEGMEDILTSTVFGTFDYSGDRALLWRFLRCARDVRGQHFQIPGVAPDTVPERIEYEFWPWWNEGDREGCEPDVVLRIDHENGAKSLIVVEAKYRSGKSQSAVGDDEEVDDSSQENEPRAKVRDQLAREWGQALLRASDEGRTPFLIYLTQHYVIPKAEVDESRAVVRDRPELEELEPYWLSWRHLDTVPWPTGNPMLEDLHEILTERLHMRLFHGVTNMAPRTDDWRFEGRAWNWSRQGRADTWTYRT